MSHGEWRHRCLGAIVGNAFDDAQAWPAMRTVGVRVAETALERICNLLDARDADRRVGGDLRMRGAPDALGNPELRRQMPIKGPRLHTVNSPSGGGSRFMRSIKAATDLSLPPTRTRTPSASFRIFARKVEITRQCARPSAEIPPPVPGHAPEFPTRLIWLGARRLDANSWRRDRCDGGPLLYPRVERRKTLPCAC